MGKCAFFIQIPELARLCILLVFRTHLLSEQRMNLLLLTLVVFRKIIKSPLVVLVQVLLDIIFRMQELAFAIIFELDAILFVLAFK